MYSDLNANNVTIAIDSSDVSHRFQTPDSCAINTQIIVPDDIEANIIANTIQVWRNIRVQDSYPDTYTVRDIPRGWSLEGQLYSCYFEIISSSGRSMDFGDRKCTIDGQEASGIVNIPSGIHKFSTISDNWYDISSAATDLYSEEYLKSIDPLYPYNHKLLIEGIPYNRGFDGKQVYIGTDLSAAYYCTKTTMFDLHNNNLGFGVFAVKNIGVTSDILAVFLQYDNNNTDYINEQCLIRWNSADSAIESYKYIKLRAELGSDDTDISPEITGYRIKLGA